MTSVKDFAVLNVLGIDTEINDLSPEGIYRNLRRLKDLKDVLDEHEKILREKAFETAEKVGKQDDKGSYIVKLPDGTWFKKEARTSVKVKKDEAVELLEKKGLEHRLTPVLDSLDLREVYSVIKNAAPDLAKDVTFTVEDAELEQAFYQGEITDEELQNLVERKVTFALKLKSTKK